MDKNDINNLILINQDALSFIEYIINEYGDTLALDIDIPLNERFPKYLPEYHHDYFYFCLTKATRSLSAANILADMYFREDAIMLARSAYETYLLMANVISDEHFIKTSIIISLMLTFEEANYFKRKNGSIDYHKVIIKGSDKPINYDLSISTLSKNTFSKYDKFIHKRLYKYMSEVLHSDFINSGAYRTKDSKKYSVAPNAIHLEVYFFIMYITFLFLQSMYLEYKKYNTYIFNQIHELDMWQLETHISTFKKHLEAILNELEYENNPYLKNIYLSRINENIL